MIISDKVNGKFSSLGALAALGFALVALPAWSLGQQKEPAKSTAPADDPVLRDLIEKGKFAEAKDRLEKLRKKQNADKNIADGVFPEKWKDILAKELPASCLKGIPKNAAMSWKVCMSCHYELKEGSKSDELRLPPASGGEQYKRTFLNELAPRLNTPAEARGTPFARVDTRPFIGFQGASGSFLVLFEQERATLEALNADGKLLWRSQFANSLPGRTSDDRWSLEEPKDARQIVLSWTGKDGRVDFRFDSTTGKMLSRQPNAEPNKPKGLTARAAPDNPLLDEAEAQRALANADYQRAMKLYNEKAISRQEFDAIKARWQVADAKWKQVKTAATPAFLNDTGTFAPSTAETDRHSPLDLGERYLKAVAELKNARSRIARMNRESGAFSQRQLDESQIELERAEKAEMLLSTFIKDALNSARAANEIARNELRRAEELFKKGFVSQSQIDLATARLQDAEARVKQIESIMAIVTPTTKAPKDPAR